MKSHFILPLLLILSSIVTTPISGQAPKKINRDLLIKSWPAKWITSPGITGKEFGVYLFRKTFSVASAPSEFIVHISADNRYKLFVNEKYVGNGPARGDLMKWHFETYDISAFLKPGKNVISAVVWNFAEHRPVAQFSDHTGLIIQANSPADSVVNTNKSWFVKKDNSYEPLPINLKTYYVVGPGEKFNASLHEWMWMSPDLDQTKWGSAAELDNGTPVDSFQEYGAPSQHVLYPREIPAMELKPQRFATIRRSTLPKTDQQFLKGAKALTIPPASSIKILIDQQHLTTAYPVITFSDGKGSEIRITYAESLFNDKMEKRNRNEIEGKNIIGNYDIILPDGGKNRTVEPLWWRTFRYVELQITTQQEPLTIHDFYSLFTAYPFKEKAVFKGSDPTLTDIWNVGWRTQRLCSGESYFDCPYYEQLQYVGDTRIQSLISTYVSGDPQLARNAIKSFRESHLPFGLTQSRYPSYQTQIIPTFSLIWITMVHDYWMLNDDPALVRSTIPVIMDVLNWYETKLDATGMLSHMEWWNFVDWVNHKNWKSGIPPGVTDSHSAIISLQYVYTLQKAATLLSAFDFDAESDRYTILAEAIKSKVYQNCFDSSKGLIADVPEKTNFSQHCNVMAILTNTFPEKEHVNVFRKINQASDIAMCSFYFQFYLIEALQKTGLSDEYATMLTPWRSMLDNGLTTFAEQADPTRSDCHAWSASPVYYMLALISGITPAEPGFKSVRIEPHLGKLDWIESSLPHPEGTIQVTLKKNKQQGVSGKVILPGTLKGSFIWKGKQLALKSGVNEITLPE